jgi:hypothetical protein
MVNIYPLVKKCLACPPLSCESYNLFHVSESLDLRRVLFLKRPGQLKEKPYYWNLPIAMNLLRVKISIKENAISKPDAKSVGMSESILGTFGFLEISSPAVLIRYSNRQNPMRMDVSPPLFLFEQNLNDSSPNSTR